MHCITLPTVNLCREYVQKSLERQQRIVVNTQVRCTGNVAEQTVDVERSLAIRRGGGRGEQKDEDRV